MYFKKKQNPLFLDFFVESRRKSSERVEMTRWFKKSLLFLLVVFFAYSAAPAQTFIANVDTEQELRTAISDYLGGGYTSGEIIVTGNITLNNNVVIQGASNLEIRGNNSSVLKKLTISASAPVSQYHATLEILDSQVTVIKDLEINTPSGNKKRALKVNNSEFIHLKNLALTPSGDIIGAVALLVQSSTDVVMDNVRISQFYGTGIILRRVCGFHIKNCFITNMNNGLLAAILHENRQGNCGIQVDNLDSSPVQSGGGMIYNNHLENLPGQGIFVDSGSNIVIMENQLISIGIGEGCGVDPSGKPLDCGGRGIYVNHGRNFRICYNTIEGVDNNRAGGGINAGSPYVSDVLIDHNTIRYAGNNDQVSLNPTQDDWNGWGISIRERAVVEWNTIQHSSTYGILIQPNASDVYIDQNEIQWSGLNNIKAVAGFTYAGQYILEEREPKGPLHNIIIRDNFLADAESYAIFVKPRSKQELIDNPGLTPAQINAWQNDWAGFDVKMKDNSLHRNDNGNIGIRILRPDPNYAPAATPTYHISFLHSGYNGQNPYSLVDPGIDPLDPASINWNNYPHLGDIMSGICYPVVDINGNFSWWSLNGSCAQPHFCTCTRADVNGDGWVNILDFVAIVNQMVSVVTKNNYHLNIVGSTLPFPETINIADLYAAIPCWGTPLEQDSGSSTSQVLRDFYIQEDGKAAYKLFVDAAGDVSGIEVVVKPPEHVSREFQVETYDPLESGYTTYIFLEYSSASHLIINEFRDVMGASTVIEGEYLLARWSKVEFLSQYELGPTSIDSSDSDIFDIGIAVRVFFRDGSSQMIRKKFISK